MANVTIGETELIWRLNAKLNHNSLAIRGCQGNQITLRLQAAKEIYLLGGKDSPRKTIYLAGYHRQGMSFSWRLVAIMENDIFGGRDIFLAQCGFCRQSNSLGGQTAKQIILGGQPPSKSTFIGHLSLADFAWRPATKDHFLGGLGIFDRQGNSILAVVVANTDRENQNWLPTDRTALAIVLHLANLFLILNITCPSRGTRDGDPPIPPPDARLFYQFCSIL